MEHSIHINGNNHINAGNILIDVPEYCPLCEQNMNPIVFDNAVISDTSIRKDSSTNSNVFQVSFITRCTRCKHLYTNIFEVRGDVCGNSRIAKKIYYQTKMPNMDIELPENVEKISRTFVSIYTQALQAEKLNLNELVGMGLRKAVEFLIKDYAIKTHPENKQEIKEKWLGYVIENFIDDDKLKKFAKGASWIANDETHYVKEWPDKDIEDIKQYIECFINYIELKSSIADIEDMRKKREKRKTKVN